MSCRYCGGDYCGSSLGGPSMCENSPTYDEVARGYNPFVFGYSPSSNRHDLPVAPRGYSGEVGDKPPEEVTK